MRAALALIVLVLVGVVVFVSTRTNATGPIGSGPAPTRPVAESSSTPVAEILSADGTVHAERSAAPDPDPLTVSAPVYPAFAAEGTTFPTPSSNPNYVPVVLLNPDGTPVVVSAIGAADSDTVFVKKYAQASIEERRRAYHDLRDFMNSVTSGESQGKLTPEAIGELKSELSWLETHRDS